MGAAIHAYIADCTPPGSRSRIFSLAIGLMFMGLAAGPTLGSVIIRETGNILSVFYMATGAHFIYAIFVWFILPESLTRRKMVKARQRYAEARAEEQRQIRQGREESGLGVWMLMTLKSVFGFLSPLAVFAPVKIPAGVVAGCSRSRSRSNEGSSPDGTVGMRGQKKKRDLSLTLLAWAHGLSLMVMVGLRKFDRHVRELIKFHCSHYR